jgi:hypothetical protein
LAKGDKGGFNANTEVFMILKISPHPYFPKRGKNILYKVVSTEISEKLSF